uniref:Epithelial sodium channel subunit gamma n=1 Tax=Neoceratodus forsteri TaxID=7892 RepID=SCNNG_NEOFS|nr:RecName: Full=Amiloride-sensitive sodium channel subunit gamma; AltName: Full=Epithelial Na(+) channel subunit gamma; Short=Gamma-ENaC; AltName: Full=Gamma-NaCH; AltName: Full=Nonvoltage-gated sodium channel 1 subunit gamma; AltName: Full=SCNEG [Neoceratodus forsteri]BAL46408.1 epithelial sodium channel subunit gamma [Neoceratodus forsteri]
MGHGRRISESIKKQLPVTGPEAPTVKNLMDWYLNNTNTHGCRRIAVSRGYLRRWIWICFTVSSVGMIFWQWTLLLMSYYTVSVSVTVQFQTLPFPAVTICNINPYRKNATSALLEELDKQTKLILKELYTSCTGCSNRKLRSVLLNEAPEEDSGVAKLLQDMPLMKFEVIKEDHVIVSELSSNRQYRINNTFITRMYNNMDLATVGEQVGFKICDANKSNCIIYTFNSGVTAILEWYRLNYLNIMAQIPNEKKLEMGYSADDLIVTCMYDGQSCDSRNFTLFQHPLHGNCYTFNSGDDGNILQTLTGGSEYGLKLTLYLENDDYNPYLFTSMGAKIIVHDQTEYPLVDDVGLEIQTATETLIGLQVTTSAKLSKPYSDCTMDGSDVLEQNLYNTSYSLQICLHSCFQTEMISNCGCAYYEQPLPSGAEYCYYEKYPGWIYCYYQLQDKFVNERLACQDICKETCNSKDWDLTKSLARWPSVASKDWVLNLLNWERGLNNTLNKNDLASIAIFYQDLNLRSLSESPANSIATLLSNMGGQLGLWMSCSIVCFLEMWEVFLVDILTIIARYWLHRGRQWWRKRKERQMQQPSPPDHDTGHHNPVCIDDEDPPTFHTAMQLPCVQTGPVPSTPPPQYNALRIQSVFDEQVSDTEVN